jgi:hypothetical protein
VQRAFGVVPILVRGEDDDVAPRRQREVREPPRSVVVAIIGERLACEGERLKRRVVELDPVRVVAVLVGQGHGVARHTLGQHRVRGHGVGSRVGGGIGVEPRVVCPGVARRAGAGLDLGVVSDP